MKWRPSHAELAVIAVVIILLAALLMPRPQSASSGPYSIRTENLTIADRDGSRAIILCTSRRSDAERLPLVLAFHGVGDSPRSMQEYSKLDKLVSHGRCVVAFLEGRRGMWATEGVGDLSLSQNRDVRFVCALLDELPNHVRFDESRVYVVGMSNGATFAELLSLAIPCRIAATAGHSGGLSDEVLREDTTRNVPILFIVGEEDGAVDWVRETAANFLDAGHDVELIVRDDLGHEWDSSQNNVIWDFLTRYRLPEGCVDNGCIETEEAEL